MYSIVALLDYSFDDCFVFRRNMVPVIPKVSPSINVGWIMGRSNVSHLLHAGYRVDVRILQSDLLSSSGIQACC